VNRNFTRRGDPKSRRKWLAVRADSDDEGDDQAGDDGPPASRKASAASRDSKIVNTRSKLPAIEPSLAKGCSIELAPELYAASELELLQRLQAVPESVGSVMLIGHNPSLQQLALLLASRSADLPKLEEKFPTGVLATLAVNSESWAVLRPGDAKLVDYVVPRELD
jgi:hypothetical protein